MLLFVGIRIGCMVRFLTSLCSVAKFDWLRVAIRFDLARLVALWFCDENRVGGNMNNKLAQYLIMLGHVATDINQGALPALLPFLITQHDLTYAQAAAFVLASNLISAVVQPLFGWMGDRFSKPWFMAAGVVISSTGFAAIGFVDSYPFMLAFACMSGVGVALYHPEGGRLANLVSGKTKGKGISIFSVGGNMGFAFGPVLVVLGMTLFGIHGTALTLLTGGIVALLLLSKNSYLSELSEKGSEAIVEHGETDDVKGFAIALIPVFMRSTIYYAQITFIPLFLIGVLGVSENVSSLAITFFSLIGAVGTLTGGPLGDKVGHIKVMVVSFLLLTPATIAFALNRTLVIALVLIAVMSFLSTVITPCSTVTSQKFMPRHLGMASGITFGVAVSVGGLLTPALGLVGDMFGLATSMLIVGGVSFAGSIGAYLVPKR